MGLLPLQLLKLGQLGQHRARQVCWSYKLVLGRGEIFLVGENLMTPKMS